MKNPEFMKHLEFTDKLNELGISIRSNNVEGKVKKIEINIFFTGKDELIIDGFKLSYSNKLNNSDPLKDLIKMAIHMGQWKHSWHNEVIPENYDKFQQIIQEKILDKAKEIELLLTTYFQINHEKAKIVTPLI